MSEPAGDRVALTKKLRDGRTAVVTVSAGGKYAIPTVSIDGKKADRQSAYVCDAPREIRAENPELVGWLGPLMLTAEEGDAVSTAMAEVQAALPPDLDRQRERLVSALDGAGLEPGIRAAELMDAGEPDPFREQAGLERRIMEARAALDAFDREHPEAAARAAASRQATVRRVVEDGL
ncbi:MAG TPA: hypothetical protein VK586_23375 [Streptosporangiaceae bacterium]|nr:hypothetical protein [Streptosporangiaceae bacterium]